MKKHFIFFTAVLFSVAALAQSNPNKAKAWMVNNITAANMQSINSSNIEFTISRSGDKMLVTARAASTGVNTWDGKVQGRIIFRDSTEKEFVQPGQHLSLVAIDESTGKTYNLPVDEKNRNQWGGAIGGPIIKDKITLKYSLNGQVIGKGHAIKFGHE
jgi:hypothetical protein